MQNRLFVSSSPHIRSKESVQSVMRDVLIALLPATVYGIYVFGFKALALILIAVSAAVGTEAFIQGVMRKQKITVSDLSAAVTGLLLAMNIPVSAPWWLALIGSIFAIAIVKQAFGGLGHNFMNPALAARAMLMASWPVQMTTWTAPFSDAVSTATPLGILAEGGSVSELPGILDAFFGSVGGCIGETSALLLFLGGLYMIYRGVMLQGFDFYLAAYEIVAGGLMLGAFFMATDYASSPVHAKGQLIYAFGAGLLTILIRVFGSLPEGVSYSILLMNVATPLIEKYTAPKVFGGAK